MLFNCSRADILSILLDFLHLGFVPFVRVGSRTRSCPFILDLTHPNLPSSCQSFACFGFITSSVGTSRLRLLLEALDRMNMEPFLLLRRAVCIDIAVFISGAEHIGIASCLQIISHSDSMCAMFGVLQLALTLSTLDTIHMDSSSSFRSMVHLGFAVLVSNFFVVGTALLLRGVSHFKLSIIFVRISIFRSLLSALNTVQLSSSVMSRFMSCLGASLLILNFAFSGIFLPSRRFA